MTISGLYDLFCDVSNKSSIIKGPLFVLPADPHFYEHISGNHRNGLQNVRFL